MGQFLDPMFAAPTIDYIGVATLSFFILMNSWPLTDVAPDHVETVILDEV